MTAGVLFMGMPACSPADSPEGTGPGTKPSTSTTSTAPKVGEVLPAWEEGIMDIHFINSTTGESVFIVMPDGSLAEIHAIFGSDPDLNEAAVKAVSKSPAWEPGTFDGEKKSTRLTVPIVFEGE